MSSSYVRTQITNFLTTNFASENLIDITNSFDYLDDLITDNSLTHTDDWLGLQFIGATEEPITVSASNDTGCYREYGSIFLHVVEPVTNTSTGDILTRAEALRSGLRGQRIGDIIIEGVDPANFEAGATLEFEGGYTSASVLMGYYRDLNL